MRPNRIDNPHGSPARVRRATARAVGVLFVTLASLGLFAAPSVNDGARVTHCRVADSIHAGSAGHISRCIEVASAEGSAALLLELDTPGGSLESTRLIVQEILAAKVPVLVWVGPPGARAASAGVFLALASHGVGMAPGTRIGAAHPVMGPSGADTEQVAGKDMARKVENDTAAFAESLARLRGRNAEWAVKAVRESDSIGAEQAVKQGVVEQVAPSPEALLAGLDGRTVQLPGGPHVLQTAGAEWVTLEPTFKEKLLGWLAHPAVAYLLLLGAGLGLMLELSSPGAIVPGLFGVVCLVLSLIAMSALPIRAGAVVLLALGLVLLVAEAFVASGILGTAGAVLLVVGGLLFVDRFGGEWFVEPSFEVPLRLVLPTAVLSGAAAFWVARTVAKTRRQRMLTGEEGLVGEKGRVLSEVTPVDGEVLVHGERWRAVASRPVPAGRPVLVRAIRGLTLTVEEAPT